MTDSGQEVEGLRSELEQKLPLILADFKKVLESHGITGARVLKFALVPDAEIIEKAAPHANVECNEDVCVIVN